MWQTSVSNPFLRKWQVTRWAHSRLRFLFLALGMFMHWKNWRQLNCQRLFLVGLKNGSIHSWASKSLSEVPCSFCLIKMSVLAIALNFGRENFYFFSGARSIPCPHSPPLNSVHCYSRALIGSIQFLSLHAAKRKYKAWQIYVCMLSRKGTSQKWLSFCCQICMYFVLWILCDSSLDVKC